MRAYNLHYTHHVYRGIFCTKTKYLTTMIIVTANLTKSAEPRLSYLVRVVDQNTNRNTRRLPQSRQKCREKWPMALCHEWFAFTFRTIRRNPVERDLDFCRLGTIVFPVVLNGRNSGVALFSMCVCVCMR